MGAAVALIAALKVGKKWNDGILGMAVVEAEVSAEAVLITPILQHSISPFLPTP
jgi:hypothetical protein